MTPAPFVDREQPKLDYCPSCASYYWRDQAHECIDAEPADDRVVIACIVLIACALVALAAGWWTPEWPSR